MPVSQLGTAQNIIAFGSITTQNLDATGIATPGSAVELTCEGLGSAKVQVTGTYTGALSLQYTLDGATWVTPIANNTFVNVGTNGASSTIASASTGVFLFQAAAYLKIRITALAAVTGTAVVTIIGASPVLSSLQPVIGVTTDTTVTSPLPVTVGGVVRTTAAAALSNGALAYLPISSGRQLIQKPYGPGETDWQFAVATGGIVNTTTAVTIKAAGAASVRNYCTGITLMAQALGTATEVAIRDGAGGAVLWRSFIPTGGLPTTSIVFPTPLRGTAATLMEFVTLTASVTGSVFLNAQGYQGA